MYMYAQPVVIQRNRIVASFGRRQNPSAHLIIQSLGVGEVQRDGVMPAALASKALPARGDLVALVEHQVRVIFLPPGQAIRAARFKARGLGVALRAGLAAELRAVITGSLSHISLKVQLWWGLCA